MKHSNAQLPGDFEQLYVALREEVDKLAGGQFDETEQVVKYPDPIQLHSIERRLLVRSVFSFIEAVVYSLKQLALESSNINQLQPGEIALAREESYEIADSGEVKVRPAKIRFQNNVRFSLTLFAKVERVDYALDTTAKGWQHLTIAAKVRDRLMHPKRAADLFVTDDEIRSAMTGMIWFDSQVALILVKTVKKLRQVIADTDAKLAVLGPDSKKEE